MPLPSGAERDARIELSFAPALVLLGLAIVINYVDRGNLSFAAKSIESELKLSATQLGFLLSAFFYTYTALQFVVGGIVDRLGANRVLSAGLLLWSVATLTTAWASGFAMLLALRLMLGVGESVAFPCTSKLIAENVPPASRGVANGVITAGLKLGPAVGAFGAGMLIARHGWRPVFLWMGLASLLWLPLWQWLKPKNERLRAANAAVAPSPAAILRQPSFWGCAAGHFCFNYLSYFLLTWLPFYLAHERHLSQETLTRIAGSYYLLDSAAALLAGFASDQAIRRGANPAFVRKATAMAGSGIAGVALLGCVFSGPNAYLHWLLGAAVGSGAAGCGVFLFAQTLAGPAAAGKWSAWQNGFGNFAGLIGPTLTGFLLDRSGHFHSAFAVTACISFIGGLAWVFGIRFAPINWSFENGRVTANEVASPR